MLLKEYIKHLQDLIENDPEVLELKCFAATDDEGNSFCPVMFTPTCGVIVDGHFTPSSYYKKEGKESEYFENRNAIVVN